MKQEFKTTKDGIFAIVKKDGKFVIVMGGYQVSVKQFDTMKQAEQYLGTKPYEIIANMCLIITKKIYEKNEKTNEGVKES